MEPVSAIQDGSVPGKAKQHKPKGGSKPALDADTEALPQQQRESHGNPSSSADEVAAPDAASTGKSTTKQREQQRRKDSAKTAHVKPRLDAPKAAATTVQGGGLLADPTAASGTAPNRRDSAGTKGSPSVLEPVAAHPASSNGRLLPSKSSSLPAFALPGSNTSSSKLSRLPSLAGGLKSGPMGSAPTSTRIAMPSGLSQLSNLRSRAPPSDVQESVSPSAAEPDAEAAAAAAAAEVHLKTVLQQFDALLHNTLQRTKESVSKVTQFAFKAATGKNGKTAAHRLVIMVLDMIETAHMSKRVDLFYLLDSLLQARLQSSRKSLKPFMSLFDLLEICDMCDSTMSFQAPDISLTLGLF